ncbi:hemolysin family protein [Lachnospiraceae bacterium OttesenSCG-928-E19]|nr:hemolysin family protein [Lachnospiraceae bacterium OttesenSCG-928-E19]
MDPSDAKQIIILIILLLLSAFFSSAETAMTTVNKIRIRSLAEEGNKRAETLLQITDNSAKMLSTILILNNVVNLTASSISTSIAIKFGGYAVGIATGIITLLILIFGEITPKTMATIRSERIALRFAGIINLCMKLMTPFVFIINSLSTGILLLFRIDPNAKSNSMTEGELRTIVDVGHEDGVIEDDEKKMIHNVFDLGDAKAKDVMVPRVHMTFANVNNTYEELLDIFKEVMFTRLPVYEETTDNVIGTINMKDLLLYDNTKEFSIRDILREAYFTYEYKSTSELLVSMREDSINMAIVLDEYGETAGLITLEDLLEEIVGEIRDEYDENEVDRIRQIGPFEYIVDGSLSLDDLDDFLDIQLESEDYDSLGGLIIEHLDRLPEEKDEITTEDGIRLVVEKIDKNRAELVHIYLPEKAQEEVDELLEYGTDE